MSTALATITAPRQLSVERAQIILAECKSVDEAKDIKDKAIAVAVYLREKKAGTEARDDAFEVALRAERRMGELLARFDLAKGGRPRKKPGVKTDSRLEPVSLKSLGISKKESMVAQRLSSLPDREFEGRVEKARAKGKLSASAVLATTGAADHDGDSWMTPEELALKGSRVMRGIDLDPASTPEANNVIKAKAFYTKEQDGRTKAWKGRVWLNPPYSAPLCGEFVKKLLDHHEAGDVPSAILLVNAATDTTWFQDLMERYLCCLTRGRTAFLLPGGRKVKGNMYGQAIFFLGCDREAVRAEFGDVGVIVEAAL